MPRRSANINVMVRAAEKAGRGLIRDFGEVDHLQVSRKGPGDFVSAAEALEMGLVSEVVPDEEVETRALEVARKITQMPPLAVKLTKEVVNAGMDASLETGLLLERKAFEILFSSEDQKEGMQAFIEKRRPEYKGK